MNYSKWFAVIVVCLSLIGMSVTSYALPRGSYRKTCTMCRVNFNQLSCYCKNHRGNTQMSIVSNVSACRFVRNDDGRLKCLPRGSFLKSCRMCRMRGNNLNCQCEGVKHNWQSSVMANAKQCHNIINVNGTLTCTAGRHHHYHRDWALPRGSYSKTCKSCRADEDTLSCMCQRKNKNWHFTNLRQPYQCASIQNINGHLQCD